MSSDYSPPPLATPVAADLGGSGVANIGTFAWGSNNIVFTTGVATALTLPATGTLSTLAGVEALTNKTVNGLTITASTGTLTITNGKVLACTGTLTLAGTDGSTLNIGTGGTLGTGAFATAFNPAIPGTLGGTTPAAITGTTITVNTKLVVPRGAIGAGSIESVDGWRMWFDSSGQQMSMGYGGFELFRIGGSNSIACIQGNGSFYAGSNGEIGFDGRGAFTNPSAGALTASIPFRLANYTVAGLPSASGMGVGATTFVTDASTTLILGIGTTVVGGGANKVPVYSDGTNWIVG